jgi:hypothetical protein
VGRTALSLLYLRIRRLQVRVLPGAQNALSMSPSRTAFRLGDSPSPDHKDQCSDRAAKSEAPNGNGDR